MKRFDPSSIKSRMIQRLQVFEEWASIINNGTISNVIDVIAEGNSEIVRYLEHLYLEKKFRTARNMSSLTHLADLIAYKRMLPKSATGSIIVSHTDGNGINRLQNYGSIFLNIDQASDYDDLVQNEASTLIERSALIPWIAEEPYIIPKGTIFKSSSGVSFISTEVISSRVLREPFSSIKKSPEKLADFYRAGGWNGIKYCKVPVIQGEQTNVQFGFATGKRFETFTIDSISVENASNSMSKNYFHVTVIPMLNGVEGTPEEWEKIESIRLAGPYDKVFESKIFNNEDKIMIKFGDGITGQMLPNGAKISCEYLETKGEEGNVPELFQITSMAFPNGMPMIDFRKNKQENFLNCTNIVPIAGGKSIQDETNFRIDAPPSYLRSYSIATTESYLYQIFNNLPMNLLHCRIFDSDLVDKSSYGATMTDEYASLIENSVLTEIASNKQGILISAIKSNGEVFEDPVLEFIDPMIKAFGDKKSPNDSFDYLKPNIIHIRPNVIVHTTDTMPQEDIISDLKPAIMEKYSVFSTEFEKPLYKSEIVEVVQVQPYTNLSEVFLEAKQKISNLPLIYTTSSGDNLKECLNPAGSGITGGPSQNPELLTLLKFPFQFDSIFGQNEVFNGFKNHKNDAKYLLRVDIKYRSNPDRNKTIFLFDNRIILRNTPTLEEAELLKQDELKNIPIYSRQYYSSGSIVFLDEYSEFYQNRQVRTAIYPFIDQVTNDVLMKKALSLDFDPFEHRPLLIDNNGKNVKYLQSEVPEAERLSLQFNYDFTGNYCYRKNTQYYFNTKILFEENYKEPTSEFFASGSFIVPLKYMLENDILEQLYTINENETDILAMAETVALALDNDIDMHVYAQPIADSFVCDRPYDVIVTNEEDILIQKQFITG